MEARDRSLLQDAIKTIPDGRGRVSVAAVSDALGSRTFGGLLLIFTIPNFGIIPSIPLLPFICGLPAIILGLQMTFGKKHAWLPSWAKKLSASKNIALRLAKFGDGISRIARPRGVWIFEGVYLRLFGILTIILTFFLCLPLPGLNIIPGLGMLLLAVGIFRKDAAFAIWGVAIGITGVIFLLESTKFAWEIIKNSI